jgi:hypothetical protein
VERHRRHDIDRPVNTLQRLAQQTAEWLDQPRLSLILEGMDRGADGPFEVCSDPDAVQPCDLTGGGLSHCRQATGAQKTPYTFTVHTAGRKKQIQRGCGHLLCQEFYLTH